MPVPVPTTHQPFKSQHSFEKRKAEADRIRLKYPDRVPIICERAENSDVPLIDKVKYLVPQDLSVSQFIYVIRKRIKLPADQALFLFINNTMPAAATPMSQVYKEHADSDGFLFCKYASESTFGSQC